MTRFPLKYKIQRRNCLSKENVFLRKVNQWNEKYLQWRLLLIFRTFIPAKI